MEIILAIQGKYKDIYLVYQTQILIEIMGRSKYQSKLPGKGQGKQVHSIFFPNELDGFDWENPIGISKYQKQI